MITVVTKETPPPTGMPADDYPDGTLLKSTDGQWTVLLVGTNYAFVFELNETWRRHRLLGALYTPVKSATLTVEV